MSRIRSVSVSEARAKLSALVDDVAATHEPLLVVSRSKVRAVLLSVEAYNDLVEAVEDLEDSLVIAENKLRNEPTQSMEEFLAERQQREMTG